MPRGNGTGPGSGMGQGKGLGQGTNKGRGRGKMGGPFAAGPGGNCACPNCSYKQAHVVGQPCSSIVCPKCGTQMTRE